ncbi:MAG: hypothetical protein ABR502_04105 [Chitinophagaceae bacterium]
MKRKWLFIVPIIVLIVGVWMYYLYQKPRTLVADREASYVITAEKLYQEFAKDEELANKKYSGKIIEVVGKVADVQAMDNTTAIILSGGGGNGGVNCSIQNITNASPPSKDEMVTVKGRCTGFLMDVNLVDAVIKK